MGERRNEGAWGAKRCRRMTYDARRHHIGGSLTIGTGNVIMVHGAEGCVWSLRLEVDTIVGRTRILVVSKLFWHVEGGWC